MHKSRESIDRQYTETRVETRKSEVVLTTSEPKEMLGKYLAKRLQRTWIEEFVDEETNQVVPIERSEIILEKGTFLSADVLQEVQFFLSTGDITSVEVSNQCREGVFIKQSALTPWFVTASIGGKNKKFLLHADSIQMAVEVAEDYIELNYQQFFYFVSAKEFGNCIVIKDEEQASEEEQETPQSENTAEKKYYKVDISLSYDETGGSYTFVVHTTDVDSAKVIIEDYLYNMVVKVRAEENKLDEPKDFKTTLQAATQIPVNLIIEREFSLAYTQ